MALVAVIAFSGSGGVLDSRPAGYEAATVAAAPPEKCPSVQRAIAFYSARVAHWSSRLGAAKPAIHARSNCPRYVAHVLQRKAYALRRSYARFWAYHYAWREWLPDKWQRIGACETGYGRRPGNWRHANSSYGGAFGFALGSWTAFTPRADPKAGPYPRYPWEGTPRQQYEVALAIWRAYGFSGWGCRGA